MTVKLINQTHAANIYGVYDQAGQPIGTVEEKLFGYDAGTYAYALCGKYTKRDIKKYYNEYKKGVQL